MEHNMNGVSYSCSDLKFASVSSAASLPVADSALYLGEIPPYKHESVSELIRYLMHNVTDDMHKTHHIFCEMDVLHKEADDLEWKESARWVKYEEDVEDGGERWSKPHVASLSMHSLFALKKCIREGAVLLDVPANDMPSIIDSVIKAWRENCGLTDPDEQEMVRKVLLKRHKHLNAKRKYKANQEKLRSNKSVLDQNPSHMRNAKSTGNLKSSSSCSSIDSGVNSGEIAESVSKANLHFMKKIPKDSEAACMMVGTMDCLSSFYMAFVRLMKSATIGQLTEVTLPTKFIFILLSPNGYKNEIQEIGRSISTMMIDEIFGEVAYKCRNKTDLIAGIEEFMVQGTVLPPGEWDPKIRIEPPVSVPSQELRRSSSAASSWKENEEEKEEELVCHVDPALAKSGKLFGGLVIDIKRKAPWYLSDFRDSLHLQSLASVIFLFLATFTQNVTFGGILGDATDGYMGTMECILTAALTGVVFSLFAGQPMNILGSTGPMLVLEGIIYTICRDYDWDFMPVRFWIGMWTTLLLLIIVAFDLSTLVKYITRFTEESFACLIAIIFILEAFEKLIHIGSDIAPMNLHPEIPLPTNCSCILLNSTEIDNFYNETFCTQMNGTLSGDGCNVVVYKDNVFLMSILLFLGTFTISMALKMFRNGPCFPTFVRQTVSDFSVFIAIIVMSATDASVGLDTPKLVVPSQFQPTDPSKRGWLIDPISKKNPWWLYLATVLPALLACILIFLDQQITSVIVNRKENKMKKGGGYHLDMLIVAILVAICSVLGLPWYVAATVSALAHIMSLKKESQCNAPGERPTFLGVREQRVTGALVGILSGVSVLITSVLQIIPMPVLYGVFFYMGIVALSSMQLMTRLTLFLIPKKYQDDLPYLRHVQLLRVHLFTIIQVICLGLLVTVKSVKQISIIFPVMVLATCLARKGMDYIFTQRELKWLDDLLPNSKNDKKKYDVEGADKSTAPDGVEQNGTGNKPTFYISGDSTNL